MKLSKFDDDETCAACPEKPLDWHHFIRRSVLRKEEYKDKRFQIPLCMKHHDEVHFNKRTSGIAFYQKYKLLDLILEKCGYDQRLTRWIFAQECKQNDCNLSL